MHTKGRGKDDSDDNPRDHRELIVSTYRTLCIYRYSTTDQSAAPYTKVKEIKGLKRIETDTQREMKSISKV